MIQLSPNISDSVRPRARAAVLLGAALVASTCGPGDDRASAGEASGDAGAIDSPHPRAAYLTNLTFVGMQPAPSLVHLRFENVADRNRLALSYQGWAAGPSAWTPILDVRDTIPVARAAWRVVPAGELRLRVGSGGQIEAVRLPVEDTPLRIEALDVISSWSSSTGQRETLRSAELVLGPGAEPGLLLQRRRARPLDSGREPSASHALVLTDSIGDGLIILKNRTLPDAPATVWAWIDGERIEWSDALLLALNVSEGSPGRWSMEIARENLVVEIEGFAPVLDALSESGSSYRLYPIRATMSAGDQRRTLVGVGIEDDGP